MATPTSLAAYRQAQRQRRTAHAPDDCMTIANAENNALRTRAALRLLDERDSLPCDVEPAHD